MSEHDGKDNTVPPAAAVVATQVAAASRTAASPRVVSVAPMYESLPSWFLFPSAKIVVAVVVGLLAVFVSVE